MSVDRREAIRMLAGVSTALAITPVEAMALRRIVGVGAPGAEPRFFTVHEYRTVRLLADMILPADERSGSASDVGVPEFIDFMERNAGLASSLIFEFTQADLAIHDRGTERNLAQLSDLGFRFSVDGVTSLDIDVESLIQRRISFLKIDATTALETLQDADASLQLHRMKRALDRAGINLIVEKIEEEEQLIELLDYGIDFGQGYLFGTPRLSRED